MVDTFPFAVPQLRSPVHDNVHRYDDIQSEQSDRNGTGVREVVEILFRRHPGRRGPLESRNWVTGPGHTKSFRSTGWPEGREPRTGVINPLLVRD